MKTLIISQQGKKVGIIFSAVVIVFKIFSLQLFFLEASQDEISGNLSKVRIIFFSFCYFVRGALNSRVVKQGLLFGID